jgi:hypothetical protein
MSVLEIEHFDGVAPGGCATALASCSLFCIDQEFDAAAEVNVELTFRHGGKF